MRGDRQGVNDVSRDEEGPLKEEGLKDEIRNHGDLSAWAYEYALRLKPQMCHETPYLGVYRADL